MTTGTIEFIYIPTNNSPVRMTAPRNNFSQTINDLVDGWFDCVRTDSPAFVGYVNDEGLLMGMEPNMIATALFGRFLVGPCVIVGSLNADGEYDGESYNAPEMLYSLLLPACEAWRLWDQARKATAL